MASKLTENQKTKTTKTKTTLADKRPMAGQRAVHFHTLAIIVAACGLPVPASGPRCTCTALAHLCIGQLLPVSLALVSVAIPRIH